MKIGWTRRELLSSAGLGACLASACALAGAFVRFMRPNLVSAEPGPVEVGEPERYPVGSLTYVQAARAFLGRDERGFYALVAKCTHLGCIPRLEGESLVCPCHGSRFTREGQVVTGPAPRPLDRAFVGRAENGRVYLDLRRRVEREFRLAV